MNAVAVPALTSRPRDAVEVVRVLVLLQAATLVVSTLEGWIALGFGGGVAGAPMVLLTAIACGLTFAAVSGIGRRAAWARRLTLVGAGLGLVVAVIDLGLSLVMTGQGLPLVAILTRLLLPVAVIAILRDATVRAAFRVPTTQEVAR